jgi:hypothetical protein
MASEPISKLLGTNPEIQPIAARLKDIERLQERYRAIVPAALAAASRVCAIEGKIVVIGTANGAIAAALRQIAPRLLEALREAPDPAKHSTDQDITSIRVEVQVNASQRPRAPKARGEVPQEKLAQVSSKLADSPLKDALERMSQARKSRSSK